MNSRIGVERFDYVRLGEQLAVVRLMARVRRGCSPLDDAVLVVARGETSTYAPARACKLERRGRIAGTGFLWTARFALELDVVEYPSALFELVASGHPALALPVPDVRALTTAHATEVRGSRCAVRLPTRRVAAMATALAFTAGTFPVASIAAASTSSSPSLAIASTPASMNLGAASSSASADVESASASAAARAAKKKLRAKERAAKERAAKKRAAKERAAKERAAKERAAKQRAAKASSAAATSAAQAAATEATALALRSQLVAREAQQRAVARPVPQLATSLVPNQISTITPRPPSESGSGSSSTTAPGPGSLPVTALSLLSRLLAGGVQPPSFLVPIYEAAGRRYDVPWQVLAAINAIETDYGQNVNTSSAGAIGWMQFMPATWREYGLAVDHRGRPNPYSPRDAIFSAARYLAANGAARSLRKAIFAYNHATWYVDEVLATSAAVSDHGMPRNASARRRLFAMRAMALLLDGEPYVYGGGHADWVLASGYDCSGFVSAVLHAGGFLNEPQTTQTLPSQSGIRAGAGRYVTVFDRTDAAIDEDHVIIDLDGQWWESGGSNTSGGRPSVHRIKAISPSYLASFNQILHPAGM
jgi:Transglycosylase SLT domain